MTERQSTESTTATSFDPGDYTDEELVAQTRRLLRTIRRNRVDATTRSAATRSIAAAADALETKAMDGPFWQTGYVSFDQIDFGNVTSFDIFRFSPAVGSDNPIASPVDLRVEGNTVEGTITIDETKVGPPFDIVHGGIIALIYDDLVGLAAMIGSGGGLTASLTIDYRKPTPAMVPIQVRAWFEEAEGRKLTARGEMRHDGILLNEARGLFVQPTEFPPAL